jgi:hypothetical protein
LFENHSYGSNTPRLVVGAQKQFRVIASQGEDDRQSVVYKSVHEHLEGVFNAELRQPRLFQLALTTLFLE